MKKRWICWILTVILVLGLLSPGAFASPAVYDTADALDEGGQYVLTLRQQTVVPGGTLFTFTMDGTVEGTYSIKGGPGYLYATRGALSCTSASVSAQASWTVTMADGALTLRNNTGSQYYLIYSGGAFSANRNAGEELSLYDAEGKKLTALPEGAFQAYICSADGSKLLSDTIAAEDAQQTITADYVVTGDLSLASIEIHARRMQQTGGGKLWQYRDGKLFSGEAEGLNEALEQGKAPDAVVYADGRLQVGGRYLCVRDGALGMGEAADAAQVQLWKKAEPAAGQEGTYLAITCDIHYKYRADFAVDSDTNEVIGSKESVERMNEWLDKASADFGGVYFDQLVSCGDQGDANTSITGANYWARVGVAMDAAADHEKVLGGGFFINGNHEWQNGQFGSLKDTNPVAKRIRLAGYVEEGADYILYSLSASQTNNSFETADIAALDTYLSTAPKEKPIFIVSHFPLHNFNRTEQRRDELINVLNKYADTLQIIFLWGHNHTEEDPNYGVVFNEKNIGDSGMDIPTVKFTYCAAGCMTDDEYDVHAVFTKPKGMIAYIAPDRTVSLSYYDVNYDIMSTTILEKPALAGHDLVKTEPRDATCTEEGISAACWRCVNCGLCFSDEEGKTQIDAEAVVIPALGHAYQNGVCTRCGAADPDYVATTVNKDALAQALEAAGAVERDNYTDESLQALDKAVEAAGKILEKEDASQAEVDAAAGAVTDAIDALVEAPPVVFRFDDVADEGKFYYDPVYWAYFAEPQITNGADATHFGPDNACTRGHVVTFLWRAAGCPEPETPKTAFTDLKPGAFYEKAVAWAVENRITNGTSATAFSPDKPCTRGQIVAFLYRFKDSPAVEKADSPFTDLKPGAFYEDAVAWAVANKITNGMTAATFGPDATCKRGQVVTFLYRAMDADKA